VITRRSALVSLMSLLGAPIAAEAQPAERVHRIGFLTAGIDAPGPLLAAFRQGLSEFGYIDGRNLIIEWRFAEGRYDRFPALARDLVALNVEVIVADVTAAVQAAKVATAKIPIIMIAVHDPVASGLVASLAKPGGNVTGLSLLTVDLVGKQIQLLKAIAPRTPRVAVLSNPGSPPHRLMVEQAERASRELGLDLRVLELRGPEDFDEAFATMVRDHTGALLVLTDGMFFIHRARLANHAVRTGLPSISGFAEYADAGGLISYAPSLRANLRRAATYVDKLLKGVPPADLPVEQPTKFELAINLKTAKALGLTIPPSLLLRADLVIE
jgi:putative ABC transport system substrate-binding protein